MGFFDDLKKEISQAVTELVSDEEMLVDDEQPIEEKKSEPESTDDTEYMDEDDYIETESDYEQENKSLGVIVDDFASDEYVNTLDIDIAELVKSYTNELTIARESYNRPDYSENIGNIEPVNETDFEGQYPDEDDVIVNTLDSKEEVTEAAIPEEVPKENALEASSEVEAQLDAAIDRIDVTDDVVDEDVQYEVTPESEILQEDDSYVETYPDEYVIETDEQRAEVEFLNKLLAAKKNIIEQYDELKQERTEKEAYVATLGVLAIGEKKSIKLQIDRLDSEISKLENKLNSYNTEIVAVRRRLKSKESVKNRELAATKNVLPDKIEPDVIEEQTQYDASMIAALEAERLEAEEAARELARHEAEKKAKLEEEEARRLEAKRLEEEEAERELARIEEERQAAEEAKRLEEERLAAEEAKRLEEERLAAEEAKRLEEERLAAEEAKRLEEERLAAEEAKRIEEEKRAAEEAKRIEAERKAAEAKRIEEKKLEEIKAAENTANDYSEDTAIITKGITIKGDIEAEGSINIFGTVEGNITCKGKMVVSGNIYGNSKVGELFANNAHISGDVESTGSIKIGQGSVIIGNIKGTSAVVAGAIKGDIDVNGPVIVDSAAIVMGDIKSKTVQINNGAAIEGRCSQCYADVSPTAFFKEN